jgi:phage baseplate assembly protein V
MDTARELLRIWSRMRLMIAPAKVLLVNDSQGAQTIQGDLGPQGPNGSEGIHDGIPALQHFGFSSNPPAGSDVVIIHIGGDRSNGVAIASGNQQLRPTGLSPGDSGIYDSRGAFVRLTAGGLVINAQSLPVTINNASQVTINASGPIALNPGPAGVVIEGNVSISGNLTVTGDGTVTENLTVNGEVITS